MMFTLSPKKRLSQKGDSGFTLIELVIAIALGSILLFTLESIFVVASRTNEVVGTAIQNQNATRVMVTTLERDVRPALAVRVSTFQTFDNPSGDNYYSVLDIKTTNGKCVRWTARPTVITPGATADAYVVKFAFKRQVRVGAAVLSTTPEANPVYPKNLTFVGISNVFAPNPLGYTSGVQYSFNAGLAANRTQFSGTVFATSTPRPSNPCW